MPSSSSPAILTPSLKSAPFPQNGETEGPFSDPTVLIVVPSRFDPDQPFEIVVYFHGFWTEIAKQFQQPTVAQAQSGKIFYGLDDQMERAKAGRILVAPQLPRSTNDGSPGKLTKRGAAAVLLEEVCKVLAAEKFKNSGAFADNFASAPVIVASYSGGYRAAACFVAPGSGIPKRVKASFMLDSLYGKANIFVDWMKSTDSKGIFVSLARAGEGIDTMQQSRAVLAAFGMNSNPVPAPPNTLSLSPGAARVYDVTKLADHPKIPVAGPPPSPLLWFLNALPVLASTTPTPTA